MSAPGSASSDATFRTMGLPPAGGDGDDPNKGNHKHKLIVTESSSEPAKKARGNRGRPKKDGELDAEPASSHGQAFAHVGTNAEHLYLMMMSFQGGCALGFGLTRLFRLDNLI